MFTSSLFQDFFVFIFFSLNMICLLLSHWVMSDSLWPHGPQHARLPCPSPFPGAQTQVHSVGDAIQLSCSLWPPSIFPSIRVFSDESNEAWEPWLLLHWAYIGAASWLCYMRLCHGCCVSQERGCVTAAMPARIEWTHLQFLPGKAVAPHSSPLAWNILWTEEPCGLQSRGSWRVRHYWATSLSLFTFTHWRRKWQPIPAFLPGESRGGGAWWAAVYGVAQSRARLKQRSSSSSSCGSSCLLPAS